MTSAIGQMALERGPTQCYRRTWMKRHARLRRKAGQALIEYAFLFILLATITLAVLTLAGQQLQVTFNDIRFDLDHLGDATVSQPHDCSDGTTAVWRHNKYRCKDE